MDGSDGAPPRWVVPLIITALVLNVAGVVVWAAIDFRWGLPLLAGSLLAFVGVVVVGAKHGISPIDVLRAKDRPPPRNAIERATMRGGSPVLIGVLAGLTVGASLSGVTIGHRIEVGLWAAGWTVIATILFRPRTTRALDERAEQIVVSLVAIGGLLDGLGLFHNRPIFPGANPAWPIAFACWVGAAVVYDGRRSTPGATSRGE